MDYRTILVEAEGPRVDIVLNRPEARNAIDMRMAEELTHVFRSLKNEGPERVVVVTGAVSEGTEEAKATFCAGGDLKWMTSRPDPGKGLTALSTAIHDFALAMLDLPLPVIGSVNGGAVGAGLGIVLNCDMAVAADTARFNTGFINVGLAPGYGTYFLPRVVGRKKAFELIMLAETFDAATAKDLGIVNRVVRPAELDPEIDRIAGRLAAGPPIAIGAVKRLINMSQENTLRQQFELEARTIGMTAGTDDFKIGTRSFFEKKKPGFTGK